MEGPERVWLMKLRNLEPLRPRAQPSRRGVHRPSVRIPAARVRDPDASPPDFGYLIRYFPVGALALTNDGVAADIAAIEQQEKDGLDAMVGGCVAALTKHKTELDADADPDALIAVGEALVPRLKTLGPAKTVAKDATKSDTEELDVLEGRLLEIIAALNSAGRKAFRAQHNQAKVEAYKYHFVTGRPSATGGSAPSPTPGA